MSRVAYLFDKTSGIQDFLGGYVRILTSLLSDLDLEALASVVECLDAARRQEADIYLAGNGGSAATAMHWANDLRAIECTPRFRSAALSANPSVITCIGNDEGYDRVFSAPLEGRIREGDVLILLSASGNSPNVLAAAEVAHAAGATVIGVVGFDGGALSQRADLVICAKTQRGDYGPVEDAHLAIAHMVSNYLRLAA